MKRIPLLLLSLFLTLFLSLTLISESYSQTVYVTKSGKKYHTADCSYSKNNPIPIDISEAVSKGYTPCSRCKPDSETGNSSVKSYNSGSESVKGNDSDSVNSSGEKVQCSAMTKKGTRCKHTTKSPNGKCWQHGGN